jgi:hypothetical protein
MITKPSFNGTSEFLNLRRPVKLQRVLKILDFAVCRPPATFLHLDFPHRNRNRSIRHGHPCRKVRSTSEQWGSAEKMVLRHFFAGLNNSDGSMLALFRQRWHERVQHADATFPLCIQTFMTGLLNILLYTTSSVWVGFQTGNMVQFSGDM